MPRKTATSNHGDGELWAKILSHRSRYYISREDRGDKHYVGDEAEIEIVATIDAIAAAQRKHIGHNMVVSLLAAERYVPTEAKTSGFFGSLNLRGSQRSALAYLPAAPFWALPQLINARDAWICLGWTLMGRGSAHLASLFLGDAEDRERLIELAGNVLVVAP